MINVSLINLGCAKNQVDSEAILSLFDDKENFVNISVKDMLFKKYKENKNGS